MSIKQKAVGRNLTRVRPNLVDFVRGRGACFAGPSQRDERRKPGVVFAGRWFDWPNLHSAGQEAEQVRTNGRVVEKKRRHDGAFQPWTLLPCSLASLRMSWW